MTPKHTASSLRQHIANLIDSIDLNSISSFSSAISRAMQNHNAVYVFGNGGSAALAAHFVADLLQIPQASSSRMHFKAFALSSNESVTTALANDYGYRGVFHKQIRLFAEQGDILFGISTSGRSSNILQALSGSSHDQVLKLGLTSTHGKRMAAVCDHCVIVDSESPYAIETTHLCFTQLVAWQIRDSLGIAQPKLKQR
jgi:D-sedoheptulose 7-phosphate isomerase